jgi:alpha-ketoglutarate-dependent taurine dioxygenase
MSLALPPRLAGYAFEHFPTTRFTTPVGAVHSLSNTFQQAIHNLASAYEVEDKPTSPLSPYFQALATALFHASSRYLYSFADPPP